MKNLFLKIIILLLIIGLCIYMYINTKWSQGLSGDIPSGYFVSIYAHENSIYKLDYSQRDWELYLYIEKENIRGISVHKLEKIGDQAGILDMCGYQETIEFKTMDQLTKFIDDMEIIGIGDIDSSRINNGQAIKYLKEHGTEIKTNELIGTGRYSMTLDEFKGLLKIIYQSF